MPSLSLTLCGSVGVAGPGIAPDTIGAKSLALLAFAAIEPGPHTRDELTALLWGEYPEEKAKASLRQALTHLREAVPGALRVDRTSVSLNAGEVECDVNTFLRLARESPRAAAEFPVSRFLDGLHLRRCSAFEDWVDATRASLVKRMTEVLTSVTREALATRQWSEAVRHAERWVAVAPLSAAANAARIEALFMSGDRELALDAFGEYRMQLATETGQRPEPEVLELVERIRASKSTASKRQATEEWYAAAPSFQGSLVGRDREWEALTQAWRKTADGSGRVALIEGDAGVGKSRLADDVLRWVSAAGGTVLRGRAHDVRGGTPFGAIIEALRSGIDAPGLAGTDPQWLAEVARVVPDLRSRFPGLANASAPTSAEGWRLFEGIAQLLIALTEEAPVAVLVDDLQWCDADSCALLHSLIRRLDGTPVFWCLTFSAGAVERDMPAARLVRALRSFPQAQVIALRPLGEDDVWQLVRGLGRVSTPTGARRLAARIHEVTTGYPFYIVELLKTLFAQGWLTVDAETGEWIVSSQESADTSVLTLAPTVHDAIAERIHCLPDELGAVLISIAVSARGCRADVLSHVHGISRLRAAADGDALVERHLAVEEDGVYRCAHPVIARVVSDALGTARRREVHRGLALALELAADGTVRDPGEVAQHAEQGGERAMTYRYAMLAAAECESRFAYEEALGWLDMAAASSGSAADTDAVNVVTARLLDTAGWHEPPRLERPGMQAGRLAASDFDLRARASAIAN
jgi:DNA-binding SARP family transcriptional activator